MDRPLEVSLGYNRRSVLAALAFGVLRFQDSRQQDKKPVVYNPGGDVKAPKVIHYVEPELPKDSLVAGAVKLRMVVTPDGIATDIEVTRGLNEDEDKAAVEAVKQWRFQPGTKNGEAVHVRVNVEIAFHLM